MTRTYCQSEENHRGYAYSTRYGSILTDANGNTIEEFSGETTPFGDQDNKNLFYTGKQWDEDAELYYFNARWYDPKTARFITKDPIKDGMLWHAYCHNNPIGFVDPTGLSDRQNGHNPYGKDGRGPQGGGPGATGGKNWERVGKKQYEAQPGATLYGLAGRDWGNIEGHDGTPEGLQVGQRVTYDPGPGDKNRPQGAGANGKAGMEGGSGPKGNRPSSPDGSGNVPSPSGGRGGGISNEQHIGNIQEMDRIISSLAEPTEYELWRAHEVLKLSGIVTVLGDGTCIRSGYAVVNFSNGETSFTHTYDVISGFAQGLNFGVGDSFTETLYTKLVPVNTSPESIIKSFYGYFTTMGFGLSLGSLPISLERGFTYTTPVVNHQYVYDPSGWEGETTGGGIGLGYQLSTAASVAYYFNKDAPETHIMYFGENPGETYGF